MSGCSTLVSDRAVRRNRIGAGSVERMKRILIVEDVEVNRDLLVQFLEEEYTLFLAVDGAEGLAAAARHRPDLILMDLSLPVLDGWEAIRRLKSDAELAPIPVIALTAHAMSGDEERARAAGCDDFLTKPIDEDLLFATLNRWLS
jgi:two-component system, cell cycle response regulator DivK